MARALVLILCLAILAGFGQGWSRWLELPAAFRLHLGVAALVAGALLLARRRRLAVLPLAAGVLALAALGPVWAPSEQEGPADGVQVRVLAANVFMLNADPDAAARALIAEDADVLITVETPRAFGPPLSEVYPNALHLPQTDRAIRTAIWSRLPIEPIGVIDNDNRGPLAAAAVVEAAEGARFRLIGVHVYRAWEGRAKAQVEGLAKLAGEAGLPLAIAGDFNASPWQRVVGEAAAATGTAIAGGYRVTWQGQYPGGLPEPWGQAIDHVLVSPDLGLTGLRTVEIPGSDHKGLAFTLTVPRPAPRNDTLSEASGEG